MQIHSVGIDLGKTTFHLVALGAAGKVLVRKKFTRNQLLAYTANMPASLIGLEACAGAHFLGRALRKQGHDVRLIAGQFLKLDRRADLAFNWAFFLTEGSSRAIRPHVQVECRAPEPRFGANRTQSVRRVLSAYLPELNPSMCSTPEWEARA
jgi:hypothetical protein